MVSKETIYKRKMRLKWIKEAMKKYPEMDYKELVMNVVSRFGICERKAKEDIKVTQWELVNEN